MPITHYDTAHMSTWQPILDRLWAFLSSPDQLQHFGMSSACDDTPDDMWLHMVEQLVLPAPSFRAGYISNAMQVGE